MIAVHLISMAASLRTFSQNGGLLHFGLDLAPATESAQMIRYGNNVPSLYTGAMSFSIPVYTYSDADFTIPISLDYHFDGFKPAHSSGTIGYGWYLNCGGIITREIFGLPDEQGYFITAMSGVIEQWKRGAMMNNSIVSDNAGSLDDPNGWSALFYSVPLINYNGNHNDASADIFHFTIPCMHGDFMMLNNGSFQVFNTSAPFGTVCVQTNGGFEYEITTGDGTRYTFGSEGAIDKSSSSTSPIRVAAYKLKRITAPNGRTATFIYRNNYQINMSIGLEVGTTTTNISRSVWSYTNLLESISIDGRTVVSFIYENKKDPEYTWSELKWDATQNHLPVDQEKKLSCIKIFNKNGTIVQCAELNHTYISESDGEHYRMFLSGVNLSSDGRYTFSYDVQDGILPGCDNHAIDHWGFWNGSVANMFARDNYNPIDNSMFSMVNNRMLSLYSTIIRSTRNPSINHSKKGALISITYPSGGRTDVEYEKNDASYLFDRCGTYVGTDRLNNFGFEIGGVRVRKLTDVSESGRYPVIYQYDSGISSDSQSSYGILYKMPRYGLGVNCWDYSTMSSLVSRPCISFGNQSTPCVAQSSFIGYSQVTALYPDGSKKVTVFNNDDDEYNNEISMFWLNGNYGYGTEEEIMLDLFIPASVDNSCMRGKVKCEEWIDSEGNSVRLVENTYESHVIDNQMRLVNLVNCLTRQDFSIIYPKLVSTTETNHGMSIITEFSYDELGRKVRKTVSDIQTGDSVTNECEYDLVFKTSVSSQSERRIHNGSTFQHTTSYQYDHTSNNRIPSSVTETRNGKSRCTTIQCNGLHRPVRIDYPGGKWVTYLWSTDGRHLLSSTSNDASNITSYTWQDLVGLTSVSMPTGQSESYEYDDRNRLIEIHDTDGTTITSFGYHLINE